MRMKRGSGVQMISGGGGFILDAPVAVWDGDTSDASPDYTSITLDIRTPVGSYLHVEFSDDSFATIAGTGNSGALTENQINNVDPVTIAMDDLPNASYEARFYTNDPTNTRRNSRISTPIAATVNVPAAGISYVNSDMANATSITIPAHQANDVIVICAYNNNATPATIPGTFTEIYRVGASGVSLAIGFCIAAGASETSGTWTNADTLHVGVYRGCNTADPIGVQQAQSGSDASCEWGGLTGMDAGADSWVIGFGTSANETPPTPGTRTSRQDTLNLDGCRYWDSNSALASYTQEVSTIGVAAGWRTLVFELLAA